MAKGLNRKTHTMRTMYIGMYTERFSVVEKGKNRSKFTKTNTEKSSHLRHKLRKLKRQFKMASEQRNAGFAQLHCILRKKLLNLQRAELHSRQTKEKATKNTAYLTNPFGFTKQLLGQT